MSKVVVAPAFGRNHVSSAYTRNMVRHDRKVKKKRKNDLSVVFPGTRIVRQISATQATYSRGWQLIIRVYEDSES